MPLGPLELVVVRFPAARLVDGVMLTLDRLAKAGDLRVVDALVVRGGRPVELTDLAPAFLPMGTGLISGTDVAEVAELAGRDTDAVAVLVEHLWVRDLAGEVAESDGTVLALLHCGSRAVAEGHDYPK